jgi:hypothetical protein
MLKGKRSRKLIFIILIDVYNIILDWGIAFAFTFFTYQLHSLLIFARNCNILERLGGSLSDISPKMQVLEF